jgi:hypothetical protein
MDSQNVRRQDPIFAKGSLYCRVSGGIFTIIATSHDFLNEEDYVRRLLSGKVYVGVSAV